MYVSFLSGFPAASTLEGFPPNKEDLEEEETSSKLLDWAARGGTP
jgi:hypothetical protein